MIDIFLLEQLDAFAAEIGRDDLKPAAEDKNDHVCADRRNTKPNDGQ